jgi:hypothetical protein
VVDPERLARGRGSGTDKAGASRRSPGAGARFTANAISRKDSIAGITATQNTARKSSFHASMSAIATSGPAKAPTVSSDWRRPKAAPRIAAA